MVCHARAAARNAGYRRSDRAGLSLLDTHKPEAHSRTLAGMANLLQEAAVEPAVVRQ